MEAKAIMHSLRFCNITRCFVNKKSPPRRAGYFVRLLLGGRVAPAGLGAAIRKSTNLGLGPLADGHVVSFLSQSARYL